MSQMVLVVAVDAQNMGVGDSVKMPRCPTMSMFALPTLAEPC